MADERATAAVIGGITLLERAVNYTLGSLHIITPGDLHLSTPCGDWDLRALLVHLDDSMLALHEAVDGGDVRLRPPATAAGGPDADGGRADGEIVAAVRDRARRLLGAWTAAGHQHLSSVAGYPITTGIVTTTGAIEIAVHGWDIARACGHDRPLPPALAEELLELSPLFVTAADRPGRFAAPVDVAAPAGPGDRLVAFLGRQPDLVPYR